MTTAAAPVYGPDLRDRILASFEGTVDPVAVPRRYRFALFVVAVAMVLLPFVYVGLIAAVAYGVRYHAIHHVTLFATVKWAKLAFILYAGPIIIGAILVVFMFKPLFSRPPKPRAPRALDPRDEPLVFAFVERICKAVGAPMPQRIDIDCQVNASASFRRGWRSFFGQDLVLTLGLPLVAGLSLQQMAGVLAHEFGHFAQGAGMRLAYVIRSVNHWFSRVVYERDALDERLSKISQTETLGWIVIIAYGARLMVWITRRLLTALMWAGHAISCFLMRQMEFDADRYEARLVGSETFESTCRELGNLGVSFQLALSHLSDSWEEGQLADSLPGLVRASRQRLDPEIVDSLGQSIDTSSTGLFDTHPADRDRIANARREDRAPVFASSLSATALFRDFAALSREVSLDFYAANLGEDLDPERLRPVDELVARQEAEARAQRAMLRFFQGAAHWLRPLRPTEVTGGETPDPESGRKTLRALRERLAAGGEAHLEHLRRYDEVDTMLLDAAHARALITNGVPIDFESFGLAGAELSDVMDLETEARRRRDDLAGPLAEHEETALARLSETLWLLWSSGIADRDELVEQVPALIAAARGLGDVAGHLTAIRRRFTPYMTLLERRSQDTENETLRRAVDELTISLLQERNAVRDALAEVPYPFEHRDGHATVAGFLVSETLENELAALEAGTIPGQAHLLHDRIMRRLADVGERIETELGLEPLEAPTESETPEENAS